MNNMEGVPSILRRTGFNSSRIDRCDPGEQPAAGLAGCLNRSFQDVLSGIRFRLIGGPGGASSRLQRRGQRQQRIWEGNVRTILGLALSCVTLGQTAALESNQKAAIVDQPALVCLLTGEQVLGPIRRCFYPNCFLGITVKSDESCPLNSNLATLRSKTSH
jgi:hypothetical protein